MRKPICAGCGNDGTQGSLYVTVDAKWIPESNSWELVERVEDGGHEIDCLACDHRTSAEGVALPYPMTVAAEVTSNQAERLRIAAGRCAEAGEHETAAELRRKAGTIDNRGSCRQC